VNAAPVRSWQIAGGRSLSLDPWAVMGIVNATPDSFSDGGVYRHAEEAAEAALAMAEAGAAIVDVGGESTRPGAARVPAAEQIRRVVPVIDAIRRRSEIPISVDTTLAAVAEAALAAGADAVNDVSAGVEDPPLLHLVGTRGSHGCGLVLMHRLAPPGEDRYSDRHESPPRYRDLLGEVESFLLARAAVAEGAGVDPAAIALDPGLGFGKSVEQNYALLAGISRLAGLGRPLLVGVSRKSFIGAAAGVADPLARMPGSVVAACAAWAGGARIIRTHDVAATVQGLRVMESLVRAGDSLPSPSP
jgi:dihydropteroate synthase